VIPQHGIAGHQDLVDSARLRAPGSSSSGRGNSAPATPPPELEKVAEGPGGDLAIAPVVVNERRADEATQ
jgi:Amt family ammonium transporter